MVVGLSVLTMGATDLYEELVSNLLEGFLILAKKRQVNVD